MMKHKNMYMVTFFISTNLFLARPILEIHNFLYIQGKKWATRGISLSVGITHS